MPVHIFGNPCDMSALRRIAGENRLALIEDAAEAHGAVSEGKRAGALSDIAAFSFFANKNITTGEGGMVLTDDDELASRCRCYRNLCFPLDSPRTYLHDDIGFNYRMSNLHAAVGLAQMERADAYRTVRIRNGLLYRQYLSEVPGIIVQELQPGGESVFWMNGICVRFEEYGHTRDELAERLKRRGIETRLFFNGMHRQPALRKYGCDCSGAYPVSDFLADNGLYLPGGSALEERDIQRICTEIAVFARHREL
jgi:perosamine synthetase